MFLYFDKWLFLSCFIWMCDQQTKSQDILWEVRSILCVHVAPPFFWHQNTGAWDRGCKGAFYVVQANQSLWYVLHSSFKMMFMDHKNIIISLIPFISKLSFNIFPAHSELSFSEIVNALFHTSLILFSAAVDAIWWICSSALDGKVWAYEVHKWNILGKDWWTIFWIYCRVYNITLIWPKELSVLECQGPEEVQFFISISKCLLKWKWFVLATLYYLIHYVNNAGLHLVN